MGLLGASRLPRSLSEPARLQIPFDPEFPVHLRLLPLRSPFAFLHVCRYVGKPRAAPCSILPASSGLRRPKTSSSFAVRFTSRIPGFCHRLEESELPLTTAVEQTSGHLYTRFETQLLCVERPGPLQILYRDPRRDLGVFKHSLRPPSYRVALDGIAGQVGRHPPKGGYCGPGGDPCGQLSRRPRSGYRRTRLPRTPSFSAAR